MTSGNFDWLADGARKNPEGLLLLAAGAILLMRGKSRARSVLENASNAYGNYSGDYYNNRYGGQSDNDRYGEDRYRSDNDRNERGTISRAASAAKGYASDIRDSVAGAAGGLRDTVTETAGEYASSAASAASEYASRAQSYAGEAGRAIADRSSDYAHRAQSTLQHGVDRVLQEQPLAIALAGFAAGAAVAAAFPVSSFERDNLGGVGGQLNEAAEEGKRMLGTAAKAAREEIEKVAADKGINAEGLKDAAREVKGAVETSLSGKSGSANSSSPGQYTQSTGQANAQSGNQPGQSSSQLGQSTGQSGDTQRRSGN